MPSDANSPLTIDDFGPLPVDRPESVASLCELVQAAREASHALYPTGGRTQLGLGTPPTRLGRAVDTTALANVIDYPARDMTITVGAGITLARLQEILADENQRLPIDVPFPDRATLGGAVAVNASGPRRFGFGTLRDYVIGISAVNDLGEEIKAGGRVVKNVAGYDLCKLFVGSLGTLGIVTQLTLKVQPKPEAQAMVVVPTTDARLRDVLDAVHQSQTRPVCVEVLSPSAAPLLNDALDDRPFTAVWTVIVGFEESIQAVDWQVDRLIREELPYDRGEFVRSFRGEECEPVWAALRDLPSREAAEFRFKVTLPPSRVPGFAQAITLIEPRPVMHAQAGNGIIHGHLDGSVTLDEARFVLERLRALLGDGSGSVTVTHCPPAWKAELPIWGEPRADWELMRAVKHKLDPDNLFNPGRFVGGI